MSYFKNISKRNIELYAKAINLTCDNEAKGTPEEIAMQLSGDTSLEQIYENDAYILIVSTDSCVTVLNMLNKKKGQITETVELH